MKGQVVPETYGGSRYVALLILNLGTRLTPQEGIPVPRMSPRGGLDSFGKDKIFPLPGLEPRTACLHEIVCMTYAFFIAALDGDLLPVGRTRPSLPFLCGPFWVPSDVLFMGWVVLFLWG